MSCTTLQQPHTPAPPTPLKRASRTGCTWKRLKRSNVQQNDDARLMRQIVQQNDEALERLYNRYSADVYTVAMRVLQNPADAEDALIDTFWELWNRPHRYDPKRATVHGYVLLVAKSRAIDHRRKRQTRSRSETNGTDDIVTALPAANPTHELRAGRIEQRKRVLEAMHALDPRHRRAIRMSFLDGMTHNQIAGRLGQPLGTVKTWIRQGLIELRDQLANLK